MVTSDMDKAAKKGCRRCNAVTLEPLLKVLPIHLDVPEDLAEESWAYVAAPVNRNRGPATVGVLELPMTAFGFSQEAKAHSLQGAYQLARLHNG